MISFLSIIGFGTLILIFLAVVCTIISYILTSIALQRMANKAGLEEVWLAWVPIGNLYIIGKLVKQIDFGGKTYEKPEFILPGIFLFLTVLRRVAFLGSVVTLLMWLLTLISLYFLYKKYAPEKVTKYMAISMFMPIIGAGLVLFRIRNHQPLLNDKVVMD